MEILYVLWAYYINNQIELPYNNARNVSEALHTNYVKYFMENTCVAMDMMKNNLVAHLKIRLKAVHQAQRHASWTMYFWEKYVTILMISVKYNFCTNRAHSNN